MTSLHNRDDVTNYAWCSGGYDSKILFVKLFQFKNNTLFERRIGDKSKKKANLGRFTLWALKIFSHDICVRNIFDVCTCNSPPNIKKSAFLYFLAGQTIPRPGQQLFGNLDSTFNFSIGSTVIRRRGYMSKFPGLGK